MYLSLSGAIDSIALICLGAVSPPNLTLQWGLPTPSSPILSKCSPDIRGMLAHYPPYTGSCLKTSLWVTAMTSSISSCNHVILPKARTCWVWPTHLPSTFCPSFKPPLLDGRSIGQPHLVATAELVVGLMCMAALWGYNWSLVACLDWSGSWYLCQDPEQPLKC